MKHSRRERCSSKFRPDAPGPSSAPLRRRPMPQLKFDRRKFLVGSAVAGAAGAAAAAATTPATGPSPARHDGELGAPPQTISGNIPYQEGAADVPPAAA